MSNKQSKEIMQYNDIDTIIQRFIESLTLKKVISTLLIAVSLIAAIIHIKIYNNSDILSKYIEKTKTDSVNTVVNINMNEQDNSLVFDIKSLYVKDNNKYTEINSLNWVKSNIDSDFEQYNIEDKTYNLSKETYLKSFIINNKYNYIEYSNEENNANKQLLFAYTQPNDIRAYNFKQYTQRFFELSNELEIKSYIRDYNNSFVYVEESLGGTELNINTLSYILSDIEKTTKTSDNGDTIINIDKLGEIHLSNIDNIDDIQLLYSKEDSILRVNNSKTGELLFYVFSAVNEEIHYNLNNMLRTNVDGLYIHMNFYDEYSDSYMIFLLIKDDSIYGFKVGSDDIMHKILKQLGIDRKDITIDKVQTVIYTEE